MRVTDHDTGEEFDLDWSDELRAALQRHSEAECVHEVSEIRSTVASNGSIHFRRQCQTCGDLVSQAISKAQVPPGCIPMDQALQSGYRAERRKQHDDIIQTYIRKQKAQGSEWWLKYNAYLKTPEWQEISGKVIKRAGGVCEGCGRARAIQAHHLTYAHVFDEFLFELVAVCKDCHDRLHADEAANGEWSDGFPCEGCRYQSENGPRRWCGKFDVLAVNALAVGGQCGPNHAELEPLR